MIVGWWAKHPHREGDNVTRIEVTMLRTILAGLAALLLVLVAGAV